MFLPSQVGFARDEYLKLATLISIFLRCKAITQLDIFYYVNRGCARLSSGRAGQSGPGPALRWPLAFCPSSRAVRKLVLFGICVRTLRLQDKISATPSGWNYFAGRFPRVVLAPVFARLPPSSDFGVTSGG